MNKTLALVGVTEWIRELDGVYFQPNGSLRTRLSASLAFLESMGDRIEAHRDHADIRTDIVAYRRALESK